MRSGVQGKGREEKDVMGCDDREERREEDGDLGWVCERMDE